MRIIISSLHFDWRDTAECLGRAKDEFGVDGVELSWHGSLESSHCSPEDMDLLSSARDADGLTLGAHLWGDLAQSGISAAQEELLGWLNVCEKTGTTDLVIHGGTSPNQKEGIAHTRRIFESVLPRFERAGVVLNLENHYAYDYHDCQELFSEPWEFMEVLSLESPSLKFCFDTGHGNMTGNWEELILALAPWLQYIHLADNQGVNDDHDMFREGSVDWDGLFVSLGRIGFDGTFCVEFPVRQDTGPFRRCVQELRDRWPDGENPVNVDEQ